MPVKFDAADQAVARAVVLKNRDVGSVAGWKERNRHQRRSWQKVAVRGSTKRSDLLVTGATASEWRHPSGVTFMSEVWVLKTSAMVSLDWQRTVGGTGCMACVAEPAFPTKPGTRMISYKQTTFPKLGSVSPPGIASSSNTRTRETTVKMMFDFVLIAKGRTESQPRCRSPPMQTVKALDAAEARMAGAFVNRATA